MDMSKFYYESFRDFKDAIQESIEDSYDPLSETFSLHPKSIVGGYALGAISKQITDLSESILAIVEANIDNENKLMYIEHLCIKRKELEEEISGRIERMFRVSGIKYDKNLICLTKWEKESEKDQRFD